MTGHELGLIRASLGISEVDLAKLVGVRPSTLRRWEQGEAPIPSVTAACLYALRGSGGVGFPTESKQQ